jgi:hypothetical protein
MFSAMVTGALLGFLVALAIGLSMKKVIIIFQEGGSK